MQVTGSSAPISRAFVISFTFLVSWDIAGGNSEGVPEHGTGNTTTPYVKPNLEGLHWVETFDGDVWTRWTHSQSDKYNGQLKVQERTTEALIGDVGLLLPEEAKHYGISTTFAPIEGKKDVPFVVQFEVKFQDGLTCGGSYIKLFYSGGQQASMFKDDTPYVVMFGPDKCGGTNKVHFILRHTSPKTGKTEEKHCKDPPSVPQDQLTHLYRLVISPDNSFEIHIDGERKTSGSLLSSMEPPVNPPKEIDDPADTKPTNWVDKAKMDDPSASKPDDWDEDAPRRIVDPKASRPVGWDEEAPLKIPDPAAKVPEDWDEEEDGEWEAPVIDNPACKVGCGKWEPPTIENPAYKGKWYAPQVDNPAYKGVWKPRQIANPDYFVDETPCILPKIDSVGIDVWTMSKGIMFDNILVASDPAKAKTFADETWKLRSEIEKLQEPKRTDGQDGWWGLVSQNLTAIAATALIISVSTVWCCCVRRSPVPPAPSAAARRASQKKDKKEKEEKEVKQDEKEEKEKEEEEHEKNDATEEKGKEREEEASEQAKSKPLVEGGLGDISGNN